ncbi:hypothetical protein [Neptuniibacter sp. QD37_11]|uniref:hypothetical protein n=1 Tax=Neptuniibacter sp. QD37_11 TaxID=3398209 RepID=UPI0039F4B0D6
MDIQQAFYMQRHKAISMGVGWELSLEQWIALWRKSGQLSLRGREKEDYVMGRIDRSLPFAVGNIEIRKQTDNGRYNNDFELKRSSDAGKKGQALRKGQRYYGEVITPLGKFPSARDAALAHGLNHNAIEKRIESENYPEYIRISSEGTVQAKKPTRNYSPRVTSQVRTPLGVFETAKLAASAHDVSPATMGRWLKGGDADFQHVN